MTIKEAITLFGGAATELVCDLAKPENNTTQLQRYIDAYDMAISALRAQQEKQSGGWISVEDRLPSREGLEPDEVEYVLVSEQSFDAITGEKLGSYVSICGFGYDGWSKFDNFGHVRTENITHWMPLPDPPQEE